MTISSAGPDGPRKYQPPVRESIEEQAKRRGIRPVQSIEVLPPSLGARLVGKTWCVPFCHGRGDFP